MQWANPTALWWLMTLPALCALYGWHWWWKRRVAERLGNPLLVTRRSGRKQVLQFVLIILAMALMIVALARPRWGERERTIKREGIDIVVALDISRSMLAADVNPSRLRAAKDELERVLGQLRGDRVGLVVFTGVSFAQSPLTKDYGAIRFYLRKLDPSDMPVGGTASGRALIDAIELLTGESLGRSDKEDKATEKAKEIERAKTQVVVLITDGEDHQGDPLAAAEMAAERGIRVYTIGFGSEKGEPIPLVDGNGQRTRYLKDRQGNTVYTKLNDQPLRDIAAKTGGVYYHYSGQGSMANAITETLNSLEKSELASLLLVEGEDRFPWFLGPALLLLFIATWLGDRRGLRLSFWRAPGVSPERHGDEERFDAPPRSSQRAKKSRRAGGAAVKVLAPWLLLPVVVALSSGAQGCDQLHERFVMTKVTDVERGNELIAQGEDEEALKRYKAAEQAVPSSSELFYDLGIGFLANAEHDQAIANLSRAVESEDEALRFKALFNLGVAHFQKEQWKESLEAFKGALRLRPDDEDAKVAFEVALAKVYPRCVQLEDDKEENDEREAATAMEEPSLKALTLCGGDEDWFAVPIYADSIVRAKASFKRLREKEPGDPEMLPKPEMLRLVLFGPDGESILGVAEDNPEEMTPPKEGQEKAERVIGPLRLTADMLEIPQGSQDLGGAFLRVVADEGLEFEYDLTLEVIPPCFALEDKLEDNDVIGDAKALGDGQEEFALHVCKEDEDWMTVDIKAGETLFIDVLAELDAETAMVPPLEVDLFDESGTERLSEVEVVPTPVGMIYGVQLRDATEDRKLVLRVRGKDNAHQGPYKVRLYRYSPCGQGGVGDDRLEENDEVTAASELPRGEGPVRHLRLCPGDADFYTIAAQEGDRIVLGFKYDELEADADADAPPVVARLWNEAGNTMVTEAVPVQVAPPNVAPVQLALSGEELEEDTGFVLEFSSALLEPRFYNIIPLDGDKAQPPPQPQQQQGDQEQDEQEQDQDQEQDGEGQEEQDEQDGDPQESPEQGEDDQEQQEESQPSPADEEPSQEGERREAIEQLLENLEDSDDNFQLKKALQDVPDRYIENDW